MTEKENRVRQCEIITRIAETKVREARIAMEQGYAKLKAEMEREYEKLKLEFERSQLELEREKSYLATAKTALEEPFKHNED